jgi:hypothetical protein
MGRALDQRDVHYGPVHTAMVEVTYAGVGANFTAQRMSQR